MSTEDEKVIQLHKYSAVILEKDERRMWLMWCVASNKIIEARSKTVPVSMFIYKDVAETTARLREAGWETKKVYDKVEL